MITSDNEENEPVRQLEKGATLSLKILDAHLSGLLTELETGAAADNSEQTPEHSSDAERDLFYEAMLYREKRHRGEINLVELAYMAVNPKKYDSVFTAEKWEHFETCPLCQNVVKTFLGFADGEKKPTVDDVCADAWFSETVFLPRVGKWSEAIGFWSEDIDSEEPSVQGKIRGIIQGEYDLVVDGRQDTEKGKSKIMRVALMDAEDSQEIAFSFLALHEGRGNARLKIEHFPSRMVEHDLFLVITEALPADIQTKQEREKALDAFYRSKVHNAQAADCWIGWKDALMHPSDEETMVLKETSPWSPTVPTSESEETTGTAAEPANVPKKSLSV